MTTVFIKGLGLIGSSLTRAIRREHLQVRLIASDPNPKTQEYALNNNIVDQIVPGLTGAQQADYVILAGPVGVIIDDIKQLGQMRLKENVVVTDVGSTKQTVMQAAQVFQDQPVAYIGGHPMAGSHKIGVWAGRSNLFDNAFYFQIPLNDFAEKRLNDLHELLRACKVNWLEVSAEEHDKIVAQISHLPHIIASGLVNQTEGTFKGVPLGMQLAAGGFKTITRIASSDPTMWSQILLTNSADILQQLAEYQKVLNQLAQSLKDRDEAALYHYFAAAKESRDQLGPESGGHYYDLFIMIPDQVGSLADVTQRLAAAGISVVNLHIQDSRGVLQLTFATTKVRDQARQVLIAKYPEVVPKVKD